MKFKHLFIAFNGAIVFFLALMFLIPFIAFGVDFALLFWRSSWPLAAALGLFLVGISLYYLFNRRLFYLLEREDWPALVRYLEGRVLQDGRFTPRLVRLLANSYLVLADAAAVMDLERKLAHAKPALVNANALLFGVARILGQDPVGAARLFSGCLEAGKGESPEWIRWYYGFALLLNRQFAQAGEQFSLLTREARDALITGMSAYFLGTTLGKVLPQEEGFAAAARDGKERVKKTLPSPVSWRKESEKMQTEVYAVVLLKYIGEAGDWLYGGAA